ncbi:MAG TPA: hypothetical protein VMI94_25730 [Bryobacteraceae bacterium]|nr:hypothetical protein [Bryobacteraceae bacterium]
MPEWEALEREVRDLAGRVAELEAHLGLAAHPVEPAPPPLETPVAAGSAADTASLFPVVGRALLGLAGAYLLRSLAEAGVISPGVGSAAGILYAAGWLVWAGRTPASARLQAAVHSLTAVLVLAPLLWEGATKFHAISTWTAAGMLMAFGIFALAVSWRKNLLMVATIATLAVLGTSAALLLATHDLPPFTTAFLALAAAVELSACLDHWLSERWLAAAAADLSLLLAIALVTGERGLPEIYAPIPHTWLIGAMAALLIVYLSSMIVRTLLRGFPCTGFEIAQSVAAFAIVLYGALRLSATDPRLAPVIGALVLCGGAGCYWLSFLRLEHRAAASRNFYTYSTFAIVLVLAGSRILLHAGADWLWLALTAACAIASRVFRRTTLAVHAGVFLLVALVASGAARQTAELLLGGSHDAVAVAPALWLSGLAALIALAFSAQAHPAVRLALAAMASLACAAILAGCLNLGYHALLGATASPAYCATLRTAVLVIVALLLAWAAARWKYTEFSRLVYPVMMLGAYRLLVYDLHEQKAALFISLLVFGAALTALPRLKRAA